jgi:sporulation protein YlmC with PRC-barrel domain
MKKHVLATLLILSVSPLALAQTSAPDTTTRGQQPSPHAASPPDTTTQGQQPSPHAVNPSAQAQWYNRQGNEIRASKLIGTSVRNSANERIGDINEVILDKSGKVSAVVIGVGGFLGMGEREVAISFASLQLTDENGKTVVMANATKDNLKAAPQWTWSADRSGTTGTSSPATNR